MPYRKPISPPDPRCSEFYECLLTNPDPVALVLLVAAASVVLLFVTLALSHIAGARSLLEEERERVTDEAEAFGAFASRVADVEVGSTRVTDGGPAMTTTLQAAGPDDGTEAVREAYRETVMSVPHYEAEYDESLRTNMSLEFGEDVADAVDRGDVLTPQLRATLVERSRTARQQRVELLRSLDGEGEALDEADRTLSNARRTADRIEDADLDGCSFDELRAEHRLLEDRREEVEAVLADRQETVQERDRTAGTRSDGPSFEQYLYGPMDVTYPVLAEGTSLVERLQRARRKVERTLASRG